MSGTGSHEGQAPNGGPGKKPGVFKKLRTRVSKIFRRGNRNHPPVEEERDTPGNTAGILDGIGPMPQLTEALSIKDLYLAPNQFLALENSLKLDHLTLPVLTEPQADKLDAILKHELGRDNYLDNLIDKWIEYFYFVGKREDFGGDAVLLVCDQSMSENWRESELLLDGMIKKLSGLDIKPRVLVAEVGSERLWDKDLGTAEYLPDCDPIPEDCRVIFHLGTSDISRIFDKKRAPKKFFRYSSQYEYLRVFCRDHCCRTVRPIDNYVIATEAFSPKVTQAMIRAGMVNPFVKYPINGSDDEENEEPKRIIYGTEKKGLSIGMLHLGIDFLDFGDYQYDMVHLYKTSDIVLLEGITTGWLPLH